MYKLYIDESGTNNLTKVSDFAPHFSIGGIIVNDNNYDFIRKRGDQIKFKYWGRTNVTFRGNNIRRLDGDFSIFKDVIDPVTKTIVKDNSTLRQAFYTDIENYINGCQFKFICVTINKNRWISTHPAIAHALSQGWDQQITSFEKKMTRILFEEVVKMYVCYLSTKKRKNKRYSSGQIIVEACNINQDADLLNIYNQFMFGGISTMGLNTTDVREILTSISFATKNNWDVETQLADIGSHFISIEARTNDKTPHLKELSSFEKKIINFYYGKSFLDACNAFQLKSIRCL